MLDSKEVVQKQGEYLRNCRGITSMVETTKRLNQMTHLASGNRSTWNNWELGISKLNPFVAREISKIVGTTPWMLMWGFMDQANDYQDDYFDPLASIYAHNVNLKQVFSVRMSDDSMVPLIPVDAELLVHKKVDTITEPTLVTIKHDNGSTWVRHIKPEISGGYTVYCENKSSNPDMAIDNLDSINITGRVIRIEHWL